MSLFGFRTWILGVKSLLLHPLRSLLTVLGIFIGTASVIWLLAIGEGISRKAQEQIEGLGASNIIVRSIKPQVDPNPNYQGPIKYGITRDDFGVLVNTLPTIARALEIREIRRQFRNQSRMVDGRLVACSPQYAEFTQLHVDRGRFLTDADMIALDNVCVLAAGTAERLFPYEDPLGQALAVETDTYVVVGVMQKRNATAAIGGSLAAQDFDSDVYVPMTTFRWRSSDLSMTMRAGSFQGEIVELTQITFQVSSVDKVLDTADVIKTTLAARHPVEEYAVVVPLELLEQAKTTRMMFILLMGMIAAISLVVGGIGIMNIMLATVTERTREIGIRRALGARRWDITKQFLVETIVLSVAGGLTGVLGGLTCGPVTDGARYLLEIGRAHV